MQGNGMPPPQRIWGKRLKEGNKSGGKMGKWGKKEGKIGEFATFHQILEITITCGIPHPIDLPSPLSHKSRI